MRVLIVHNRYRSAMPSGENAVVDEEADLLEEARCEVRRLDTSSDEIATWAASKRLTLPGRVVWSREGYRLTARAIDEAEPDVVHFHNTFPLLSPAALWAARRSGRGVVQTLHNFRPLCPGGSFYRAGAICERCLGHLPVPAVIHGCYRGSRLATLPVATMDAVHDVAGTWTSCVDLFVTPSEFARRKYVQAGWPAAKLVVKPNTARDPAPVDAEHTGVFTYLGRVEKPKGTDVLLDSWAIAFPEGGARLRLVGSHDAAASARAATLPGVELTGPVDRARAHALLAGSCALVVPSTSYEVFPRVIAEAYALGVPVIAADVGSLPELVEHRRTGLLVQPGSPESLSQALRELTQSPELSFRLGRQARRVWEEKYSPAVTTARLLSIYAAAVEAAAA
jgi:glycosyltransferase involved in cell wall biosynthesis